MAIDPDVIYQRDIPRAIPIAQRIEPPAVLIQPDPQTLRIYAHERAGDVRLVCGCCAGLMPHYRSGGGPSRSFWVFALLAVFFRPFWPLLLLGRDSREWYICRGCGNHIPCG